MADELNPTAPVDAGSAGGAADGSTDTGTPEQQAADAAEAKGWEDAANQVFPELNKKAEEEKKPDEQTDTTTTTTTTVAPESETTTTTTTVAPPEGETAEQKAEREAKEIADAAGSEEEAEEPDTAARDARVAARESAKFVQEVAADVRAKMFPDAPTVMRDKDGDEIKSIEDVMKLMNPITQKAFTQEEAGSWLLAAQQKFNQNVADMEKTINEVAEVNVDLKDQSDIIAYRYGELLKADEKLRKRVWSAFEGTLQRDPKTNIITKAPVSMEKFYDIALAPYQKLAESLENTEEVKVAEAKKTADDAAAEAAKKKQARTDRSDVFGGGKIDEMDEEEAGWARAAEKVFGPKRK